MSKIDSTSALILSALAEDFTGRGLSAADLRTGYTGLAFGDLRKTCSAVSAVDFDLALEALTRKKLVRTGPMELYDNDPNSGVVIIASFSKMEWVNLTVAGYTKAQEVSLLAPPAGSQHVHIKDSTFVNSPFGVGSDIRQSAALHGNAEGDALKQLLALAREINQDSPELESDVRQLVELASDGDLAKAKPIYQRIFGFAGNAVQQVAWGVVSSLISAHLGLPSAQP